MLSNAAYGLALVEIVWINLLLSGDNAVVIALASRSLPAHLQKWGVILGTVPAVLLRIGFSAIAAYLIAIPFLRIVGGVLLVWIAFNLLQSGEDGDDARHASGSTIWAAARTIIVADAVMSLDNVVAIVAAAHGDMSLLIIGLVISMPMVICGACVLVRLLARFPILVTAGASLLGYIAGDLIVSDAVLETWLATQPALLPVLFPGGIAVLLACAGAALRSPRRRPSFASQRDIA